jgi:hypothetical protein
MSGLSTCTHTLPDALATSIAHTRSIANASSVSGILFRLVLRFACPVTVTHTTAALPRASVTTENDTLASPLDEPRRCQTSPGWSVVTRDTQTLVKVVFVAVRPRLTSLSGRWSL